MGGKSAALFITAGILWAGVASAGLPDPDFSDVPNVLYTPGASLEYTVYVGSPDGPVAGALVEIQFSEEAMALACWCSGQENSVIQGTTDGSGMASFFIGGGGCLDPDSLSGPPVAVYADGRWLAEVGCVSIDVVDNNGNYPWQGWTPGGGICSAGTSDAIIHTPPFSLGNYSFCSDLDSDGAVTLSDAIVATPGLSNGFSCPQ
jgi:hypothetical protein